MREVGHIAFNDALYALAVRQDDVLDSVGLPIEGPETSPSDAQRPWTVLHDERMDSFPGRKALMRNLFASAYRDVS